MHHQRLALSFECSMLVPVLVLGVRSERLNPGDLIFESPNTLDAEVVVEAARMPLMHTHLEFHHLFDHNHV